MSFDALYQWLEATAPATAIRESELLFPLIESTHVVAITLVFGTIAIVDLRLLCLASLESRVSRLTAGLLPWTWAAFAVAALTGSLLFTSNATAYGHNFYFVSKLVLMLAAGINMAVFHLVGMRDLDRWDALPRTPLGARLAGALSLLIWIGVVACGRWIGFTMLRTAF
jgi:hypothetical protein